MGARIRSRLVAGFFAIASLAALLAAGAVPADAAGFTAAPGSPFAAPGATGPLALGDLNGDGNVDAVVSDSAAGRLVVLLGNGRGGLVAAPPVATGGTKPSGVALVDLNGDGRLDAAVANSGSHKASVLLGNGAGGFVAAPKSPFFTDSARPVSVVVGDFNGDTKPDVAVVNSSSADVSLMLGDGSGGLTLAGPPVVTGGDHPGPAAAGDFNGDGKLDVAVANESGDVAVLTGDGTGNLSRSAGSPFGLSPAALGAGDFNGDGKLDVAVANTTGTVTILLGNGAGALSPLPAPITIGGAPAALSVADLDRDGRLDLAVANGGSGDLSVLLGDGLAGFTPAPGTPVSTGGSSPASLAVGDLTGAGKLDLVVVNAASASVSVLLNGVAPATRSITVGLPVTPGVGGTGSSPFYARLMTPFPIVRITGRTTPQGARIHELAVVAPAGAKVTVHCAGKGCPFRKWRRTARAKTVVVKLLKGRFLKAGATLEVRVSKRGEIGKYTRIVVHKLKRPTRSDRCLSPGSSRAAGCPPA
jgi:FG-GAP-like repeat